MYIEGAFPKLDEFDDLSHAIEKLGLVTYSSEFSTIEISKTTRDDIESLIDFSIKQCEVFIPQRLIPVMNMYRDIENYKKQLRNDLLIYIYFIFTMKNYTNLKDSYRSQNSLFSSVYESLYNEKPDTNQNSILYPKVEEYFTIDPMFKQFNITEIFKKSQKKLLSHYIYAHLTIFSDYKKNYFNHKSDTEDTFMITNTLLNCLKNDNEGNISNLLSIYLTELNYDPFILNFAPNRIQKWKKKFTKEKKELEEKWTECLGGGSNLLSLLCYSPNIISRKHLIEILMKYHRVYSSNYKHEWTKLSIFESMKTDLINYIFIYQSLLRHYTYYLFEVAFQNNQDKIVKLVNLDSANILDQAVIRTNVFDDLLEIKNEIFTLSTDQLKNNLNSMPNFSSPPLTIINYCKEAHYNESDNILFPIEITTNYSEYLHDYFKFIEVNSSN